MNEHAKKIWKAWADGKQVQTHQSDNGKWKTLEPIQVMPEMMPHRAPERWRIKPKNETRYFRVYLDSEDHGPYIFEGDLEEVPEFEKEPYFGGWLTAWISYEVEVEE